MTILDNSKIILSYIHTFGVRCYRSVKQARIRVRIQGSMAYKGRLTQKVLNKKESLKLSKIFITKSFKTLLSFEIQSPDPKLAKNPDPHPWTQGIHSFLTNLYTEQRIKDWAQYNEHIVYRPLLE